MCAEGVLLTCGPSECLQSFARAGRQGGLEGVLLTCGPSERLQSFARAGRQGGLRGFDVRAQRVHADVCVRAVWVC